jgi:hypothetical protein
MRKVPPGMCTMPEEALAALRGGALAISVDIMMTD